MAAGPIHRAAFATSLILALVWGASAARSQQEPAVEPEQIQLGISTDVIGLTSDFAGTRIAVFGSIENANRIAQTLNEYAVVVVVRGPPGDYVVRRKERVAGIWINRSSRTYRSVPSFYALAADRPLDKIGPPELLREHQVGIENIGLRLYSRGADIIPAPEFAESLRQLRQNRQLFTEDLKGVVFLGTSLFRATLAIPSDVPVGEHTVTAYLFREGQLLASRSGTFRVEKQGLEKTLYTLAHRYSLWYGILAVALAIATGWLASMLFGGNRK
ncbi:MAG TPA: TIGR02186 family protein [Rhizobiaceae bacterium]|nr:TIGR02186 family protein [Rhizobiaceae bacterium]